ncbi:MAG: phosphoribosylglycinamide formyltransferase [Deltaproteobacteria bacterium]|nr:phosphoribosylglycinamide formyltransferase [Deltaproteobacteria bacterium]
MNTKIQIGVLISGGGSNLQAIIDAVNGGHLDGQIVFVGSDAPGAGGLDRARRNGIATFVVDYKSIIRDFKKDPRKALLPDDVDLGDIIAKQTLFSDQDDPQRVRPFMMSRVLAEARLLEAIGSHSFDLLVLAGFMRNLTPYFIDRINSDRTSPRIMNIHPALLPSFPGVDGYGDTFRYGCKVAGCTVHFIDYGEDTGPIIAQRAFPIEAGDSLESIRQKGLALEWELYPHCIQLFAQGRIKVVRKEFDLGKGGKVFRRIVEIG